MSDAAQLDFFQRARKPQLMAYRDRGWNAQGAEIVRFDCPKCADSRWLVWPFADADEGPECKTCNGGRK